MSTYWNTTAVDLNHIPLDLFNLLGIGFRFCLLNIVVLRARPASNSRV